MITRTVTCHYEDATGEHPIEVTLRRDGPGHNDWVIETDLSEVPDDELAGVRQSAIDQYCEAEAREHSDDDRGPGTASHQAVVRARAQSGPGARKSSGTTWTEDDYAAAGKGRLVLRVDQADLDKLDAIAKASGRSRSAVVAEWIRAWGS